MADRRNGFVGLGEMLYGLQLTRYKKSSLEASDKCRPMTAWGAAANEGEIKLSSLL